MQISADLIQFFVGQISWLRYICKIFVFSSSFKLVIQKGTKSTHGDHKFAKKTSVWKVVALHSVTYFRYTLACLKRIEYYRIENKKEKLWPTMSLTKIAYNELTHKLSLVKDYSPSHFNWSFSLTNENYLSPVIHNISPCSNY